MCTAIFHRETLVKKHVLLAFVHVKGEPLREVKRKKRKHINDLCDSITARDDCCSLNLTEK